MTGLGVSNGLVHSRRLTIGKGTTRGERKAVREVRESVEEGVGEPRETGERDKYGCIAPAYK